MKKYSLFTLLSFLISCPAPVGESGAQGETDANIPESGAAPCNSTSDCGVLEQCVQGLCVSDGSADGATDGATDGTTDGTTDGATDGATPSDGTNLALTATASASEEWSDTWSADKAIDGSMITYWSTADGLVSANFTVTLAAEKSIDQIILKCGDYPMKSFSLQVSSDDVTYQLIGEYETEANVDKVIDFTAVNAKYIRLNNITADPGPAWTVAAIYEIEIYEAMD